MSDNDRSLNDSKGLEMDLDNSNSMIEYALDDDCCSSDNQVQTSNNSSPGFVAVVPVIEVTNANKDETSNNNISNKKKLFKKNSKVTRMINNHINNTNVKLNNNNISDQFDSGYSMKDVNSTTNLLGLDESSIVASDSYLNVPNSKYSFQNNHSNTLLINAGFNSNSQSSIEPNGRYCKDVDSIPLVTLTNNSEDGTENLTDPCKEEEKWYVILLEILFPFLIAGFGMVCAGVVLDIVQHWELFVVIPAIFTLIPALLGLKGNLEMTLASRFSTQVNIGLIKDRATIFSAVMGNIALTQAQSIIVGFLASVGALALKFITDETWDIKNGLVIVSGSMSTASFASMILGGLMMAVILVSKKMNINPDNIATPIAASLGDLVTLTILAFLCTFLYQIKHLIWIHIISLIVYIFLVPVFIYYSSKNDYVKDALLNGWTPIIIAMIISSSGGFIMSFAVQVYKDIAVFQPVVNGVGGNLVAIFASRLSTALHRTSSQGTVPNWSPKHWYLYPIDTFFGRHNPESKTGCVLASLSVPGHLLFFFLITRIKIAQSDPINPACLTASFVLFYLFLLIIQVLLLLLICYWLVHLIWRLNKNPDNVCIPYLTAIGDFLGTAFLAICFHLLYLAGNKGLRNPH